MEPAKSPLPPAAGDLAPQRGGNLPAVSKDLEPFIREELALILRSRPFSSSARMKRFLRFVVEATLEGRAECLKEYVIGVEVYDRKAPYEPSQDSIVRTEALRLRGKLKAYYESEGKMDPIIISIPTGSYVPVFARREPVNFDRPHTDPAAKPISSELPEMIIVVMRLGDVSGDTLAKDCARAISEGIALQLRRQPTHKFNADVVLQAPRPLFVIKPFES